MDLTFSAQQRAMVTAALTKNLSLTLQQAIWVLLPVLLFLMIFSYFFPKVFFLLALERRRECANMITYRSGSLNSLAPVYCMSLHFLSPQHSRKELMSHLNPCLWSWPLKEWQKLSFWLFLWSLKCSPTMLLMCSSGSGLCWSTNT